MKALQIIDAARAVGILDALSRHKREVISFLQSDRRGWTAEDWQAFFDEREAIAEFDDRLPRRAAEAGAFRACVIEWPAVTGSVRAPDRCCWCRGGERGNNVLLPFGADRAGHAFLHSACWPPWRERRQAQAIALRRALGIAVPIELPNDFAKNGGT